MGMICGAFKRLAEPAKPAIPATGPARSRNDAQRSIRLRPSALNRCSFSRGAMARIRSPMAGAIGAGNPHDHLARRQFPGIGGNALRLVLARLP